MNERGTDEAQGQTASTGANVAVGTGHDVGKRHVAFLDLGGTLCAGDPVMSWAEELRARGELPEATYDRMHTLTAAYRRGLNADVVARDATLAFLDAIVGRPYDEVVEGARAAYAHRVAPGVYTFARPLVEALVARGYAVWAVTGVLEPLASILCEDLGIPRVIGTPLKVQRGRVAGAQDLTFPDGWKAMRARSILEDPGIDLRTSLAFGDSNADLSLMERVGLPVAVRPKPSLATVAVERGYAILNEPPEGPAPNEVGAWLDAQVRAALGAHAADRAL